MNTFFSKLKVWYKKNARDLPWRKTQNPYQIWISEVILQQTRVAQGLDYYNKFIHTFPTIRDLALAPEAKVLKAWQGLGYYSRARNMHAAAQMVMKIHGGIFPSGYAELLALPGIGDYTAAAISSLVINEKRAALDGNVARVVSRLYEISAPMYSSRFNREAMFCLNAIIPSTEPGIFNQGMIELGAMVCIPRNPLCTACPVNEHCSAFRQHTQENYPVRTPKNKPVSRYFHYIVLIKDGSVFLRMRKNEGIWEGLWEFPVVESENSQIEPDPMGLLRSAGFAVKAPTLRETREFKHQLTHQTIYAKFWVFQAFSPIIVNEKEFEFVELSQLNTYPIHKLMLKFISSSDLFKKVGL